MPAVLAGLVQGVTGFGSGIILMIFLPAMLPVGEAAGVAGMTMFLCTAYLAWRYRKALRWQALLGPFLLYSLVATLAVPLGQHLPTPLLKRLLGALLIGIAGYFTLRRGQARQPYPLAVNLGFMGVSGFFNGLFGIGGPLMALYFLLQSRSKAQYLASIQTFFLLDGLYVTSLRFAHGILHAGDFGLAGIGLIGALLGTALASRIVTHLDAARISQLVYLFIGLSGGYYLLLA